MHFFVSDLHMTDTGVGGAVTDEQLVKFAALVEQGIKNAPAKPKVGKQKAAKHKLVLVGDVFDLLRSPKWSDLWEKEKSAPWSGSSAEFKHFKKSFAAPVAVAIAESISNHYRGFANALKRLVDEGQLETIYVPGNHDYMFQLSPELRTVLINFLSLKHDPGREFEITYRDSEASIFATHGNAFDAVNWHRRDPGYWALGDAVVLRIVNRFPGRVCKHIGLPPDSTLGTALQDIDNIEPLSDIPRWVLWASESNLSVKSNRDDVLEVWKHLVEEFLGLKEFKDKKAFGAVEYQRLRYAFEFSTKMRLAQLISALAKNFENLATDYCAYAEAEARKYKQYRFVIFGHTHKPSPRSINSHSRREEFVLRQYRMLEKACGSGSGCVAGIVCHPPGCNLLCCG